eukprot:514261-Amorphochlora_amoeboformis.AAC.1
MARKRRSGNPVARTGGGVGSRSNKLVTDAPESEVRKRARPIFDAIESNNYSRALMLSNQAIQRLGRVPLILALQALVYSRTGRRQDALGSLYSCFRRRVQGFEFLPMSRKSALISRAPIPFPNNIILHPSLCDEVEKVPNALSAIVLRTLLPVFKTLRDPHRAVKLYEAGHFKPNLNV